MTNYFTEDYTGTEQFPYTKRNAKSEVVNYMQIAEQTYEDKVIMYNRLSKKELIEMLIACNEALRIK